MKNKTHMFKLTREILPGELQLTDASGHCWFRCLHSFKTPKHWRVLAYTENASTHTFSWHYLKAWNDTLAMLLYCEAYYSEHFANMVPMKCKPRRLGEQAE